MKRKAMTVKEMAAYLGVHTDPVYEMVRFNKVPHYKIRGKIFFSQGQCEVQSKGQSGTYAGNILKHKQKLKQKSSRTHASENLFKVYSENFGTLRPIVKDSLVVVP